MQEHPLKTLERLDPKLLNLVEETRQLASERALQELFRLNTYVKYCLAEV